MVPQPDTIARQRMRALQHPALSDLLLSLHAASSWTGGNARGRSIITYGKKHTPLSLTGIQFVRARSREPPGDKHEGGQDDHASRRLHSRTGARRISPSEPSLSADGSDDDTRSSYFQPTTRDANVISRREISDTIREHDRASHRQRCERSKAKPTRRRQPSPSERCPSVRPQDAETCMPEPVAPKGKTTKNRTNKSRQKQPKPRAKRRLPIDELFLVTSPLHYSDLLDPPSDHASTPDPIQDSSNGNRNQAQEREDNENDGTATKSRGRVPLSAIRKRLRTPASAYKAVKAAKGKHHTISASGNSNSSASKSGDGFDKHELHANYTKSSAGRKRRCRPVDGYTPLQLSVGPLPKVEFLRPKDKLGLALDCVTEGQVEPAPLQAQDQRDDRPALGQTSQRFRRAVSFSDRDDFIIAQLSSISAPLRPRSDSEESELDQDDEEDATSLSHGGESVDDVVQDDDGHVDEDDPSDDGTSNSGSSPVRSPHRNKQAVPQSAQAHCSDQAVSIDFDTPGTYGTHARRSLGRPRMIEVNEAIEDTRGGSHVATTDSPSSARPRSILKNNTPINPDQNASAQRTAANTRRNSAAFVPPNESRYFGNATKRLQVPDATRHVMMPHRISYLHRPTIQVADSDVYIPETSSEPPDHAVTSKEHVLQRASHTEWASPVSPAKPKDLRTMTRSTSRDYGTLNQSFQRRPSLPFHSPTKVHGTSAL